MAAKKPLRAHDRKVKRLVSPSKRQKPSQRNITVKDLRDIKRHHEALKSTVDDLVSLVQTVIDDAGRLYYRVGVLEDRIQPANTPIHDGTEPLDGQTLPGDEAENVSGVDK